jgi:hypothetical protein
MQNNRRIPGQKDLCFSPYFNVPDNSYQASHNQIPDRPLPVAFCFDGVKVPPAVFNPPVVLVHYPSTALVGVPAMEPSFYFPE